MTNIRQIVAEKIVSGETQSTILTYLKDQNVSIIEAVKIVRSEYKINLGDAKQIVTAHPAWREVVEQNEILHDALAEVGNKKCE